MQLYPDFVSQCHLAECDSLKNIFKTIQLIHETGNFNTPPLFFILYTLSQMLLQMLILLFFV